MRIAIDARELQGRATGVGSYLAGLLDAWKRLPAAKPHEFILCKPDSAGGTWWEQRVLPAVVKQAHADVLFSPGYTAPVWLSVPSVVAIHDVSFAAHPEWFSRREGFRRRVLTRLSARRAARVVTISEFSKREIVRHLGITPAKIEMIYPAVAARRDRVRAPDKETGRTILYAGSLFNRRHIPALIDGFTILARDMADTRLEIIGDNRTVPAIDIDGLVTASGVSDRIGLRSYVPDSELAAMYSRASVFVFLSEYEGFGFTPLEALSAGVPIVVLDTAVAREVYGAAAVYVERPEPELIAAALGRVLTDDAERARILAAAQQTLARYSWDTCAERVLDVLVSSSRCRASR